MDSKKKIKALCLIKYGKDIKKNVQFQDLEVGIISSNEVLIKVRAAGVNPVDYKIVHGQAKRITDKSPPFPLGFDLSGVVVTVGAEVLDFKTGDEVYSKAPWKQMGAFATYAVIDEDMIALKPENLTFSEAAAIPLVGCTVFDAFQAAEVKKGTKILIHAGSGGIGTFAIQYAKHLGAEVITTTSTANVDWVKNLGADLVIDYKQEEYLKIVSDVDVVFDTWGHEYTVDALKVVKKGGKIVSIAGHYDDETLKEIGINPFLRTLNRWRWSLFNARLKKKNVSYKHVWSYPNKKTLEKITVLLEANQIEVILDKEFKFEQAIDTLCYLQTERAKGKVVIVFDE